MPRKLVSDELWSQIEPLLPKHKPTPKGGRPRIPDRAALTGIVFVLKTGIPWEDLPQEMGCGSGMTCWRRLRDWQEAGVWESLHHVILQNLHDMKKIDWSRACIDGSVIQAKRGANTQDPTPLDRGRPGSKHHLITDRNGIPLVVGLTAANVNDCKMLEYMLDHLPSLRNLHGRPTCRPQKLHADKGYDFPFCRQACTVRHIKHRIARRGVDSSSHLGKHRWVVERTFAWFHRYRRLLVRYERRADIHLAFLSLAAALIAFRFC